MFTSYLYYVTSIIRTVIGTASQNDMVCEKDRHDYVISARKCNANLNLLHIIHMRNDLKTFIA